MAVAVPRIPAEPPGTLTGQDHRLRPHPPARQPGPPAKCNTHHHSATTAAQRISAIKAHTRIIRSRPFHFDLTPKKMLREPGIEPGFSWRNPPRKWDDPQGQDQRACRRSQTAQAPEHLPTGEKARTSDGLPRLRRGFVEQAGLEPATCEVVNAVFSSPIVHSGPVVSTALPTVLLLHVGDGLCAVPYLA